MLHKGKPRIFDASVRASNSSTSSTFTHSYNGKNPHLTKTNKLHSKSTYFYRWGIPSVCGLALLLGGIVTFNPTLDNSKAYAEELDFDTSNADSASNDSGIMTASDPSITLDITPDSGNTNSNVTVGEVAYFSNTITVGGTGISKYYLALSTPNGSSGNLIGKNHPAAIISKVNTNTAPANFGNNTWGYAVSDNTSATNDSLLYNPVPSGTNGDNIDYLAFRTHAPTTNGDEYKLVFAAKLGSNLPSDHYQSSVYISAVADAGVTAVLGLTNKDKETIVTMQEMSTDFCTNVEIDTEGRLLDTRDNKIYSVAKLADNNCWMTQNLAYDGGGTKQCELKNGTTCSGWPNNNDNVARYAKGLHTDGNHTSQGNFYSWEAARNGNTSASEPIQGICPDHWQLPTGNNTDSKSFSVLAKAYNIPSGPNYATILLNKPLYFLYNGSISNDTLNYVNVSGYYWSSTRFGDDSAKGLFFGINSTGLNLTSGSMQNFTGLSVRCVAK